MSANWQQGTIGKNLRKKTAAMSGKSSSVLSLLRNKPAPGVADQKTKRGLSSSSENSAEKPTMKRICSGGESEMTPGEHPTTEPITDDATPSMSGGHSITELKISWSEDVELLLLDLGDSADGVRTKESEGSNFNINEDDGGEHDDGLEGSIEGLDMVVPPKTNNFVNKECALEQNSEKNPMDGSRKRSGRGSRGGKKAKMVKKRSEILMSVTKHGEEYEPFQSLTEEEHNELAEHLDEVVAGLSAQEGDFYPCIDFITFKHGRTIIGCSDEITQKWLQDETKKFRIEYEAWNREEMRTVSATVQFPTGKRDPRSIIETIYTRYKLDGRMQILQTRLSSGGRFLLLGVDETMYKQLADMGLSVYVGLCRVDFKVLDQSK